MDEPASPLFLGAGENAVTKTKCAPFSALNNTQARRWLALSFPALGNGDDVLPVHIDDAQNRHFRHAAHFVKGPPGALSIRPSSAISLSSAFNAIFSAPCKPNARAISRLPVG